ncbi:LytR/AlgR family response regulator transcription factor [Runella sp.]|uniref:LytR/AlgR family response regulator transcription factor n=1 Tax=Runella sp. TaxID=1960881 RepID=UPI003D0A34A5
MIKKINYLVVSTGNVSKQVIDYVSELPFFSTPTTCRSFGEIGELVKNTQFDVVILDASLEGFKELIFPFNNGYLFEIIVISSDERDALKAFELGATGYLLKPLNAERFSAVYYKAIKANIAKNSISLEHKLIIKSGRRMEIVAFDRIIYIEAYGMYSKIFLEEGKVLVVNAILAGVEQQLPANRFVRIHRSYIVNSDKITGFDKRKIYLDEKAIEVGGAYRSNFKPLFTILDKE